MISSAAFLKVGKLPQTILDHVWFKNNPQIYKIFPQLNLEDDRLDNWRLTFDPTEYMDPNYGNLKIGFSASTPLGLYDIATMSMRGIASCQSWSHAYHIRVVGSVADPFCGLIYLTDGTKTEYGMSIIKRSVVRLIVGPKGPALFIERVYSKNPPSANSNSFNNLEGNVLNVLSVFKKYLATKIKNQMPIYTINDKRDYLVDVNGYHTHSIPVHSSVRYLYDTAGLSYVDSGIPYKPGPEADNVFKTLKIN